MTRSSSPNWGQLFQTIISKKIVVIGDVMLDRFIHGRVDRISPEAPVPVLTWTGENLMPGGAANVARNLAGYGVDVTLIGIIGKDQDGEQLKSTLKDAVNIKFKSIIDTSRQTTVKTRFQSSRQQMLRLDNETRLPLNPAIQKRLLKFAETAIAAADAVILSDYDKGMIDRKTVKSIIKMAKQKGVMVIADPKKTDPSVFSGVDVMTPNRAEFQKMTPSLQASSQQVSNADIADAANKVSEEHKIKSLLITLGADGMMLAGGGTPPYHVKSTAQSVFDVSGAGDTVIAALTAALAAGAGLKDATELANTAAAIVVSKSGTATTTPGEVLATAAPPYHKSEQDVKAMAQAWQDAGLTMGFTNGCFDLLHPGHLWLLEKAKARCERLVVGVNSDASTRRLKGDGRPYQSQTHRIAVLASLPMVDAVVVFDTPTPAKLIKLLNPNRLIKGGDYKAAAVVGRASVLAAGGKVIIIPTKHGFSTTRLSTS
ncbi:MAG: D-glycero-beta-D-manno-heptose-7-phosphate kinase [Candidatus Puniceispirillales bacterium WSBS_2018_MAG_OTU23]